MAGITRKQAEVAAVRFCAAKHGISERSVRNWRAASDPRWIADLAEWQRKMGYEASEGHPPSAASPPSDDGHPASPPPDDGLGSGLSAEVMRCRAECRDLALLWADLKNRGKHVYAETIGRQLDSRRDILRKLESDAARIGTELGDVVPKTLVTNYAADVAARAGTLARRLITLLPLDLAADVKAALEREIDSFRDACAHIDLRAS